MQEATTDAHMLVSPSVKCHPYLLMISKGKINQPSPPPPLERECPVERLSQKRSWRLSNRSLPALRCGTRMSFEVLAAARGSRLAVLKYSLPPQTGDSMCRAKVCCFDRL